MAKRRERSINRSLSRSMERKKEGQSEKDINTENLLK